MEQTLRLLYLLQKVDSHLDDVEELKGDLPETVKNLKTEIAELDEKAASKQKYIDEFVATRNKADNDIKDFEEKLKKYKEQQYQVRNNKEYDAITKEIEFAEESVKTLTKQFEDFENQMSIAKNELEEIGTLLADLNEQLQEKADELAIVSKETEEEELKYNHEREKIVTRLNKDILGRYAKIRTGRGKAVATIRKNSCSGCGNRVPPQHIMEIRRNDKIYLCQHCGRIVVSDELAQATNSVQ
ncbi:MAG: C4-type zinc ribbon domain-containing protein [Bacteriovoracaceae bacterium]|nr:C4-type zinc ribbon domain-containing protein [Bacteroidota bacterium]